MIKWDVVNLLHENSGAKDKSRKEGCVHGNCRKSRVVLFQGNYYCKLHGEMNLRNFDKRFKQEMGLQHFAPVEPKNQLISLKQSTSLVASADDKKPGVMSNKITMICRKVGIDEKFLSCLPSGGFFVQNFFMVKIPAKDKLRDNAASASLIEIGRNLTKLLDAHFSGVLAEIKTIKIENQISPIANRMKSIQSMLTQYWIMRVPEAKIEFISSSMKLKVTVAESEGDGEPNKADYISRKRSGVILCEEILRTMVDNNLEWLDVFSSAEKKDDLSDCFLQSFC
jgi:hypothetical protein